MTETHAAILIDLMIEMSPQGVKNKACTTKIQRAILKHLKKRKLGLMFKITDVKNAVKEAGKEFPDGIDLLIGKLCWLVFSRNQDALESDFGLELEWFERLSELDAKAKVFDTVKVLNCIEKKLEEITNG